MCLRTERLPACDCDLTDDRLVNVYTGPVDLVRIEPCRPAVAHSDCAWQSCAVLLADLCHYAPGRVLQHKPARGNPKRMRAPIDCCEDHRFLRTSCQLQDAHADFDLNARLSLPSPCVHLPRERTTTQQNRETGDHGSVNRKGIE
jgi:hypothetical protein